MTSNRPARPGTRPSAFSSTSDAAAGSPTRSAPLSSSAPAPTPAPTSSGHGDYDALRQRENQLRIQRSRLELLQEQANKERLQCEDQAKALGVNTLAELNQLIEELELRDQESLANYRAALEAETQLQAKVQQQLAAIDEEDV